jgi:bile acid:Na+ symporter, BASS family
MQESILTTLVLPIALATIMLGLGLSLKSDDFFRIFKYPKAVTIGLIGQLVILPIIALAIVKIIPMPPAIAVGLIILALCPCGPSSNMITYLAGGDVALAVTLTVFSSMITVFTIPLFASLAVNSLLGKNALAKPTEVIVALPIGMTMGQIFLITVIPIAIGMYIQHQFPGIARRLEKVTNKLAFGFLVLIVILLVAKEWSRLPGFIVQAGAGVMLLNILGMAAGFAISKMLNLNIAQQICIAIEVGIQNGTLAIAITAGILKDAEMAIPAAIYSLFMYLTGFAVIAYSKKLTSSSFPNN